MVLSTLILFISRTSHVRQRIRSIAVMKFSLSSSLCLASLFVSAVARKDGLREVFDTRKLLKTNATGTCTAAEPNGQGSFEPNLGDTSVIVPGSIATSYDSDWDLTEDYLLPMYISGNPDKALQAKSYARWDYEKSDGTCSSDLTLCVLVVAETGITFQLNEGEAQNSWLRLYDIQKNVITPYAFHQGATFWEGCYAIPPSSEACQTRAQIHVNAYVSGTSGETNTLSTGKEGGSFQATFAMYLPRCTCTGDQDCEDGDACTTNTCNPDGMCNAPVNVPNCCTLDDECTTSVECMVPKCISNQCSTVDDPDCGSPPDQCEYASDCQVPNDKSDECGSMSCVDLEGVKTCVFTPQNNDSPCGPADHIPFDSCDLGFKVRGLT